MLPTTFVNAHRPNRIDPTASETCRVFGNTPFRTKMMRTIFYGASRAAPFRSWKLQISVDSGPTFIMSIQ
jgi:hypothetical protein